MWRNAKRTGYGRGFAKVFVRPGSELLGRLALHFWICSKIVDNKYESSATSDEESIRATTYCICYASPPRPNSL